MPDLWPADFGTEGAQPPLMILREQADHLSRRTGGLVVAKVLTTRDPTSTEGGFQHRFVLEVPSLDDYTFTLFALNQPIVLYPVHLVTQLPKVPGIREIPNPTQLEDALRDVFSHSEVRKVITALKAQALATVGTEAKP